ncbi:MAG: TraB/GumN family protein [Pseudomonadota bacterium]
MSLFTRGFGLAAALGLWSGAAAALCTGTDLRTELSAEDRAEIAAEVAAEPYADSIAYAARRGDARLVLFGTVHLAQVEMPPLVTDTLAEARLLLVEATEEDSAEAQAALRTRRDLILGDPNQPLSVDLTGDEWSSVVAGLAQFGIPPSAGDLIQPWFAAVMTTIPTCVLADQGSDAVLDARIARAAADLGVPARSVEPPTTVFTLFSSISRDSQLTLLRSGLATLDLAEDTVFTLAEGWKDNAVVEAVLATERVGEDGATEEALLAAGAELEERLLVERNRLWMPAILAAADAGGTTLIAVGAAHLPGEAGLLALLAEAGFTLTPLDPFTPAQ